MSHMISVIVPVYNTEQWLPDCIESILQQTYANLEIILVDDGSSDGSAAICDAAAMQDARVRVMHTPNGGVSAARNHGLDIAAGAYIVLVDADDILALNMIEELYHLCIENDCNIAQCRHTRPENRDTSTVEPASKEVSIYEGKAMHWGLAGRGGTRPMPWAKLYERSLFEGVRFPLGLIHEDEAAIHRILYPAKRMAFSNAKLYYYRQTPDSIMNANFSIKRYDILTALQDRMLFYFEAGWSELAFATAQRYSVIAIELYRKTIQYIPHPEQHLERLMKLYRENWKVLSESPLLTDEVKQQHIQWLEDPLSGSVYSMFQYMGNLKLDS
jgi:glycosyltransferase involved in cell wall biosynthesis